MLPMFASLVGHKSSLVVTCKSSSVCSNPVPRLSKEPGYEAMSVLVAFMLSLFIVNN